MNREELIKRIADYWTNAEKKADELIEDCRLTLCDDVTDADIVSACKATINMLNIVIEKLG